MWCLKPWWYCARPFAQERGTNGDYPVACGNAKSMIVTPVSLSNLCKKSPLFKTLLLLSMQQEKELLIQHSGAHNCAMPLCYLTWTNWAVLGGLRLTSPWLDRRLSHHFEHGLSRQVWCRIAAKYPRTFVTFRKFSCGSSYFKICLWWNILTTYIPCVQLNGSRRRGNR